MTADFLVTTLIIVATPGTGAIFTLACALGDGRRSALIAAFGCTLGILPHLAAAGLGLAALVAAEPRLFDLIRYAGIAYLLWMALALWRSGLTDQIAGEARQSARAIIRKAILINLLNPKLLLFFLAFLPQFLDPQDRAPLATMGLLSLIFMAIMLAVFAVYGLAASALRERLLSDSRRLTLVNRCLAGGFLIMAGRLALARP